MNEELIDGMTPEEYLENLEAELFTEGYDSIEHKDYLSNARTLLVHLLKLIYQNKKQSKSWCDSIFKTHIALRDELLYTEDGINKNKLKDYFSKFESLIVPNAIKYAVIETGLTKETFELTCGLSPRALCDEKYIIDFLDTFIYKDSLRKITVDPECDNYKDLLNVPKLSKNDIMYLDKNLGKVEYISG